MPNKVVRSGIHAAKAIAETLNKPDAAALKYTELIERSHMAKEMLSAKDFRQTVAKFGPLQGMPLSVLGRLLPKFKIEKDYEQSGTKIHTCLLF